MRATTLQTPRSVKKEGEEVLQALEQRFLCSPWRLTVEQISTCSPWRTPHRSRWMPKGRCDPMGSLRWSRLLAGPVDPWREEPRLEQVCWQDL